MSPRTARELTTLADGTLPPERRDALLRRVAVSPELARALQQQLVAIDAIRRVDTPAPAELRQQIQRAIRQACTAAPSTWPPDR